MIEAYVFFAAFTVQILIMSVLLPAWFIGYVRAQTASIPAERLAQLYPGVDLEQAQRRFLVQYRTVTTCIAVLGLLLLLWLFSYMHRPSWDEGKVNLLVTGYFLAAYLFPVLAFGLLGVRFNKEHKRALPQGKRRANLQRRGLFDFVSPFAVFLAVLAYLLFAALAIYIDQDPFPGYAGYLINIGGLTLAYAVNAVCVYMMLYGKKRNPFETHAGRLHTIGLAVKSSVYSCIVIVVFLSLDLTLRLLDLQRWEPFSLSVFYIICALVASMGYAAPLRRSSVEELSPNPAAPGTQDLSA